MKAQALADHLAENPVDEEDEPLKTYFPDEEVMHIDELEQIERPRWKLFFDGAANERGVGIGAVLVYETGNHYPVTAQLWFYCTNNMAEYEACILGLRMDVDIGVQEVLVLGYRTIVRTSVGTTPYLLVYGTEAVIPTEVEIPSLQIVVEAEIDDEEWGQKVSVVSEKPSLEKASQQTVLDPDKNEVNFNNLTWDWRNEIVAFLQYGIVPEDKKKAHVHRKKAARYCLKQDNLYQKMFGGPLARCLEPSQTEYVMREIHKGHCGNHAGGRLLVKAMIRAGYYWHKMEEEAENFVAKCDKCQRYDNYMHRPAELLHPVVIPWPFMKWGMDIVGPLPQTKGKIKRNTSTPYNPVGNGQTESSKKVIINNFKKRLEESKVEIGEPSTRYTQASEESNEEEMCINLDLLEGKKEVALIRMAAQKQVMERYYNRKARLRYFKIGDFVLKKVFQSTKAANAGKLSPTWEGPCKIHGIAGKGAYEMETMDGKILPSHWNVVHLKRYYF
ncbi:uncharacterized protein [Nicotiana sylvestris]|uniref:uncharacterized protein n=1 Tax=Nicotiana sylvestris TaxID=4096 RepID=UPI00388C3FF2